MGSVPRSKLIILTLVLLTTSLFVYVVPNPRAAKRSTPLIKALSHIPGWKMVSTSPLDQGTISVLRLDDYINATYSNGSQTVSLYVGYYWTSKKIGAAHDPMVCFPGQGWAVTETGTGNLKVSSISDDIAYSKMIATRGEKKELIFYWFQSYDRANAGTFMQKTVGIWKRWLGKGQDNAFVRITTSLGSSPEARAEKAIVEFTRAFYPVFLKYIKDETP